MIYEEFCLGFMVKGVIVFLQSIGVVCMFDNEIVEEFVKVIRIQMKVVGVY